MVSFGPNMQVCHINSGCTKERMLNGKRERNPPAVRCPVRVAVVSNCPLMCHLKCHLLSKLPEQTEVQAASNSGLHALHSSIVLPDSWSDQSPDGLENILLCRISNQVSSGTISLRITHCLKISDDLSWSLFVNQHCIDPSKCGALKSFPTRLNSRILSQLLTTCVSWMIS